MSPINRRNFLAAAGAAGLAGCVSQPRPQVAVEAQPPVEAPAEDLGNAVVDPGYAKMYAAIEGDRFPIPAIDLRRIDPAYLRRSVDYAVREQPGTVVIDPARRYLYLVQESGRAMRYGVGVGREGFAWSGAATINSKQEWPDWYPPKEMIERQPELRKSLTTLQSGIGMAGGPRNPLGARAMYLWQGNKDTLFRIHGTVEPWTIGKNVSSGCIRMINQDAIDLYGRVPVGTKVVVLGPGARTT